MEPSRQHAAPAPATCPVSIKKRIGCVSYDVTRTALGARAYERLGEDEKAAETARLGVAQQKKKVVVADCHCVLGRVAARGGDTESAEAHFRSAMDEARTARAYVLEIIAAREWQRHVLEAAGRAAEADAVIDTACERMGKERATFDSLLA